MIKTALHYVGTRLARPIYGGAGSILALHRVVPEAQRSRLSVNRALEITPESLEEIIRYLQGRGIDFIGMDEVVPRLKARDARRFAVFTLDDGYRDNVEHALPVFERHRVPFTVHATRGFAEHRVSVWWYALEDALIKAEELRFAHRGDERAFLVPEDAARERAFHVLASELRASRQAEVDALLGAICAAAGVDPLRATRSLILSPEELQSLARHSLATIGAHTVHHLTSRLLTDEELRREFEGSKHWLEELCGRPARHLAYPFGGRNAVGAREFRIASECGFATAATTRFASVFHGHADVPWALPRLEISGNYDARRFIERAESGLLPAIRNRGRRVVME